ncbi:alpha-mannosidase [Alicyclobacillus acidiphilus]|uniref:alpha-mannosidase n=1 Tax=Alicyclobacillus acidiphilus TaxID=182455 RepID=UPI001FDF68D6|nr:glycoside hydrolase family 38 C-terminal domain-containing protein [Alicyclobacillus acidiphilus]
MTGKRVELAPGDQWGDLWDCAWFHFRGSVPEAGADKKVVLLIDVNGELCIVDETGSPKQGLTNVNSEFDKTLGLPGKRVVEVTERAHGGEVIDLWADAGCNDLFGKFRGGTLREATIAVCHEEYREFYYDFEVLLGLVESLHDQSARRCRVAQALHDAMNLASDMTIENMRLAKQLLEKELGKSGGDPTLTISAIGHAHIDLAWLWPIRETIRKAARTFSTALRMMERYPDYVFGASQPQLYQWVKDYYPSLYEQIRSRIAEGRWEVQGAMWVEPDSNISGGEALVRQVLYGKRFFLREFGKDVNSLWVPDIFGYSAALPQILKQSNVDYMMTQKLSWNAHNTHPHHTFFWQGIDGSRVLTHMPPEATYNGPATPQSVAKLEHAYLDKNVSDHALMLFGIGDGGGGPGEEHLERLKREKNLQGLCPVVQEPSAVFFEKLAKQSERFQTWSGELYLERHQGTFTTQARNKWYNRRMEKALRDLEFAAELHFVLLGHRYFVEDLEDIWKEVLLYQFHDILPGSSITRVYRESLARYEILLGKVRVMLDQILRRIAEQVDTTGMSQPYMIVNSLPWERTEWLLIGQTWIHVTVPAMGYCVVDANTTTDVSLAEVVATENKLENDRLRVEFDDNGAIRSIFDKQACREIVAEGRTVNSLKIYHDRGDSWDFPEDYDELQAGEIHLKEVTARTNGPRAEIVHVYAYGASEIQQTVTLTSGSGQIDFRTRVDWFESEKMLRSSFPLDIHADHVNCEIQFGHIKRNTHRNTSWDAAKDEICAHHWIDLSEPMYGVSLLNDCKYGYRAYGNVLDINLLRSPTYPDPEADRGRHEFTYSLLPHVGDHADALVYRSGYQLNVPLHMCVAGGGNATLPKRYGMFVVDSDQVMIEAVKKSEDDDSVVVRMYETSGAHVCARIGVNFDVVRVEAVNLLEQPVEEQCVLNPDTKTISLRFRPFEIKTVKLKF